MRKSLLAMAALMGVATLPAHAWRVNIDKETFADIGFATIIRGTYEGKRSNAEKSRLRFYVHNFNITASGQVNELVYFNMNLEGNDAYSSPIVKDSFIGLKFADEFRVQAGLMRTPFTRNALTSTYALLFPYTPKYKDVGLAHNPADVGLNLGTRDAGVVVWGNVADAMLKYYLGVTQGDKRNSKKDDKLAYTIRLQFTPTMLGFKGETGYTVADTYLGKQNVLSIGVGYRVVGHSKNVLTNAKDTKMWTVDMLYEQKFGDIVPNLQVGYIDQKDVFVDNGSGSYNQVAKKAKQFYAQGQLLYDQMVGFGKPALAVRFEQNKNEYTTGTKPKATRLGIWANYYIKGQAAKVSLGVDSVSLNSDAKNRCTTTAGCRYKNFTDVTLLLQTQF